MGCDYSRIVAWSHDRPKGQVELTGLAHRPIFQEDTAGDLDHIQVTLSRFEVAVTNVSGHVLTDVVALHSEAERRLFEALVDQRGHYQVVLVDRDGDRLVFAEKATEPAAALKQ